MQKLMALYFKGIFMKKFLLLTILFFLIAMPVLAYEKHYIKNEKGKTTGYTKNANTFNAASVLFIKVYKLLFHYLHILQELFHPLVALYFHKQLCLVF